MHAVVTEVRVRSIPFSASGEDRQWDLTSGPDLCYEAYGPDGSCLHASEAVNDVRPSDLPVTLQGEFPLQASGPHILRLLDEDFSRNEVVARFSFTRERLAEAGQGAGPPPCVQFEDEETTLWVALRWEEAP